MISVRKQEFIEMFLLGVVHLVIGISGYIVKSNMINLIAFVVATSYSIFIYTKRKFKKQQDDDDSLQNKNKAGHVTFLIFIAILWNMALLRFLWKKSRNYHVMWFRKMILPIICRIRPRGISSTVIGPAGYCLQIPITMFSA